VGDLIDEETERLHGVLEDLRARADTLGSEAAILAESVAFAAELLPRLDARLLGLMLLNLCASQELDPPAAERGEA